MRATVLHPAAEGRTGANLSLARRQMLLLGTGLAAGVAGEVFAQGSATDFTAGIVVKIDGERGTATLRHAAIAPLHLPPATTTFRYHNPSIVLRIKDGDSVLFRADRYDGSLRLLAAVPLPPGPADDRSTRN